MKIILDNPTDIVVVKERKITISEIEIIEVVDNPTQKSVTATTSVGAFLLWKGQAYDSIGQWTDADVIEEIKQQINN